MVFLCILISCVYILPESPRWLLQKARRTNDLKMYEAAFNALRKLCNSKLHAARGFIMINHHLHNEDKVRNQRIEEFSMVSMVSITRRALTMYLVSVFWSVQIHILYPTTYVNPTIKQFLLVRSYFPTSRIILM